MASLVTSEAVKMTSPSAKDVPAGFNRQTLEIDVEDPPLRPVLSPTAKWSRSAMLRKCAHAFVMALASPEFDPHTFIRTFLDPDTCRITHHGPRWATKRLPYLSPPASKNANSNSDMTGEFVGRDGCLRYLDQLGNTLKTRFFEDAFPADEQLCVDSDAEVPGSQLTGRVCLDGKGRFTHRETGWRWEETFFYRLSGFNEDGQVEHWEIWSDTLSAWEAASDDKKGRA